MPLVRISARDGRPVMEGSRAGLCAQLPPSGAVTIMIHGFKYQPNDPRHCPHTSLFSLDTQHGDPRILSWPRHLGYRGSDPDEGLAISFGWPARGSLWQAHREALQAGAALCELLQDLRRLDPTRQINVVAHSLGARVALEALRLSPAPAITRAVLLAGAEFCETARIALTSPAGRRCEVLNVTSRENDLFDFGMERLIPAPVAKDRMMGDGTLALPNLVTLQLDDPRSLRALSRLNFPIANPKRRICHWSPYTRPVSFRCIALY